MAFKTNNIFSLSGKVNIIGLIERYIHLFVNYMPLIENDEGHMFLLAVFVERGGNLRLVENNNTSGVKRSDACNHSERRDESGKLCKEFFHFRHFLSL